MRYLMILAGVVCLSFILLPSCAPQPEEQAEPDAEEAASAEGDVEAINELLDEEVASVNDGDVERLLTLVADDTVWMPPNHPAIFGKEALRSWAEDFLSQFSVEITASSEEVLVFGDWALQRYSMTMAMTPVAGGEAIQEDGKGLHIYQKQSDGSWELARDIWNTDTLPPEEPTT